MFGFPTQFRYSTAPILLIVLVLVLELIKPSSFNYLAFLPDKIALGEYWRVLTGQLLHTNLNHTLLNICGLILVWALHGEYYSVKHYLLLMLTSLILVGLGLVYVYDNTIYSGLSGVLHALLIYGAIIDIAKKVKSGWLIFVGIWLKVAYEMTYGASASTAELISAKVAVEAHLIGAIVGLGLGLCYLAYLRKSNEQKKKALN